MSAPTAPAGPARPAPRWAWLGLAAVLLFDLWLRGHTIGPAVRDRLGLRPWPVTTGAVEPLDCDEALFGYIGRRLARGAAMHRDFSDTKPPGGYWLYALAIALGGPHELTVRLLPIPLVLATIAPIWWLGLRLAGPGAGVMAATLFALLSTDPYLFGNGANLEHAVNLFAVAALALAVKAPDAGSRRRGALVLAAGGCLGAAGLVKQVGIASGAALAAAILARRAEPIGARLRGLAALGLGTLAPWLVAGAVLAAHGALADACDDVFRYGPALAALPPGPGTPPLLVRWVTGNADPAGRLPWPFGRTAYLVWWGAGSWPLWLAAVPGLPWLLAGRPDPARRLVAGWTLAAWVEVALPRLFWPHYYLLPAPGVALAVAVPLADAARALARGRVAARLAGGLVAAALLLAVVTTAAIQVRDYLLVPPEELTRRYKGGGQWIVLRALGRELGARARAAWPDARLYIWGIQSPLYFYSGLDGVTRQVFADNLIREFAGSDHPLVRPRIERTLHELRARPPELVFAGYPPYPGLRAFLFERALPATLDVLGRRIPACPNGTGLWVAREGYDAFIAAHPGGGPPPVP